MAAVFARSSTPVPEALQPYQCPLKRVFVPQLSNLNDVTTSGSGLLASVDAMTGLVPMPSKQQRMLLKVRRPKSAKSKRRRWRPRRFESKCRRIARDLITEAYLRRLKSIRVARSLAIEFIDRSMAEPCSKLGLQFALSALRIHQIHKRRNLGSRSKRDAILQVANRLRTKHLNALMEMHS